MTETTRVPSNYISGAVKFEQGLLKELVVYCIDPVSEEDAARGYMEQDYIAPVEGVIERVKAGDNYSVSFRGAGRYPLEIVSRHGVETLEIRDVGQPEKYKSMHSLPVITTDEDQAWVLRFYEAYKNLTEEKLGYQVMSLISWAACQEHGDEDPVETAKKLFASHKAPL